VRKTEDEGIKDYRKQLQDKLSVIEEQIKQAEKGFNEFRRPDEARALADGLINGLVAQANEIDERLTREVKARDLPPTSARRSSSRRSTAVRTASTRSSPCATRRSSERSRTAARRICSPTSPAR